MAFSVDDLAEEKCSPVAEPRDVPAELVAGVGLGNRSGAGRHLVAHQKPDAVGAPQRGGVEPELDGQRLVEHEEAGVRRFLGLPGNGQLRELTGEAVLEGGGLRGRDAHAFQTTVRTLNGRAGMRGLVRDRMVASGPLMIIKRLLDAGISRKQMRTAIHHLRKRPSSAFSGITLMSDGQSLYEATSNDEIIDLLQSGQGQFGIALGGVLREVQKALDQLPSETV
jgi:hypothetical protein